MANLKELRNRISSVTSTQKITRAMQMVAASKLRRAQESAEAARPYSDKIMSILKNLSASFSGQDNAPELLMGNGNDQKHLLVIATSERGLCGGFNTSIVKMARENFLKLKNDGKEAKLIIIGKKGKELLAKEFVDDVIEIYDFSDVKNIGFPEAEKISTKILELFDNNEFDICKLYFAKFESVLNQLPIEQKLIPFDIEEDESETGDINICYEYEPDEEDILKELLPKNLSIQILRALLENVASEFGARLTAMDNATRNAAEMIDDLTITYNRSRQASITSELIEIISGAEAL
ncbi:MAG: F0F1 ATP synthase subunit gamma [Pseudomonadota bacterium]|nr:F0F1 ATP synthase subunit gamma [Pseudomonadota bacterium]